MAPSAKLPRLDLSSAPPIFVLPTHLQPEELHETEDQIYQAGGQITYDAKEAKLFIGRIGQSKRAAFDLRARGLWTEEAVLPELEQSRSNEGPPRKKIRLSDEGDEVGSSSNRRRRGSSSTVSASSELSIEDDSSGATIQWPSRANHVIVVKLAWLNACMDTGKAVPFKPYLVYSANVVPKPDGELTPKTSPTHTSYAKVGSTGLSQVVTSRRTSKPDPASILERARAEAATLPTPRRRWGDHSHSKTIPSASQHQHPPKLHRTTTSEMDYIAQHPLPDLPDWATGPTAHYACCRSTYMTPPNVAFISQLLKIKEARLLRLDDIGVRAYSTSIASISAYPYRIKHAQEITRLPGCEQKIASLWQEWHESAETDAERFIQSVKDLVAEPDIQGLKLFWNIWGVGPDTARRFYFDHGWRELDDVVEFGWQTLTRVQQIGVKYYDEFLQSIPRKEVEEIRDVILRHARLVLNIPQEKFDTKEDADCVIVGGYRRGKAFSGDVDVVLSHRDEAKTKDLVVDVVRSLEEDGWITHTLTLHTTTSDRNQATLPYRAQGHGGHGFDSLDKALCVWQDPHFDPPVPESNTNADEAEAEAPSNQKPLKNPNIHRRVDIIISTWRTMGCAILGWSGGTTFQRDIRRYVSRFHGLKFDSSGVRNRGNGMVLDLEGPRPVFTGEGAEAKNREILDILLKGEVVERDDERWTGAKWDDGDTWMDRERRLMDGLGFGYRPATERCTG